MTAKIKKFFFDVETTGVDIRDHEIFQIGCLVVVNDEIVAEEVFMSCPRDLTKVDPKAMQVNGYTIEKLKQLPNADITFTELLKFMGKYIDKFNKSDKFHVYGYFVDFDIRFLRKYFRDAGDKFFGSWFFHPAIGVEDLAANYLCEKRHAMENFKQMTVAKELGIDIDESQLHDALYDIKLTKKIYEIVR